MKPCKWVPCYFPAGMQPATALGWLSHIRYLTLPRPKHAPKSVISVLRHSWLPAVSPWELACLGSSPRSPLQLCQLLSTLRAALPSPLASCCTGALEILRCLCVCMAHFLTLSLTIQMDIDTIYPLFHMTVTRDLCSIHKDGQRDKEYRASVEQGWIQYSFGPKNNHYAKFLCFLILDLHKQKHLFSMEGKRADVVS